MKSQLKAIFPDGMAHLPKEFKSRDIYCDTRRCRKHVQYLGRAEEAGFKFALFRYISEPDFIALGRTTLVLTGSGPVRLAPLTFEEVVNGIGGGRGPMALVIVAANCRSTHE